jgi:hypothetical protein
MLIRILARAEAWLLLLLLIALLILPTLEPEPVPITTINGIPQIDLAKESKK